MRFITEAEVIQWADLAVMEDNLHHTDHGVSKNPYSTEGMRNQWQRGYDNDKPHSWEGLTLAFDTAYQRGAAMKRLELKKEV